MILSIIMLLRGNVSMNFRKSLQSKENGSDLGNTRFHFGTLTTLQFFIWLIFQQNVSHFNHKKSFLKTRMSFFFLKVFTEFINNIASVLYFRPWGMWDLRSQTRDWIHIFCIGRQSPDHWTIREVPRLTFLKEVHNMRVGDFLGGASGKEPAC